MKNNADGLLVARICHDLKNCLSVVAFLKEDLLSGTADLKDGLNELIKGIDKLSLRLSFFQNLSVDGAHIGNLYEMLQQMCTEFNMDLKFDISSIDPKQDGVIQNIVCGILYIVIASSQRRKEFRSIVAKSDEQLDRIEISISDTTMNDLPQEVLDIATMGEVNVTVVNALALYIKRVIERHGYATNIVDKTNNMVNSSVKIILKKLT